MTRFRAPETDDDDLLYATESENDLPQSPARMSQRPRSPTVDSVPEDESEGTPEVTEDEDSAEDEPPAPRAARQRSARVQRGDPTIIPWARKLHVDAQKMHVMQTSLFHMPEEEAAMRQRVEKAPVRARISRKQLLNGGLPRKHSRDSEGEGMRADSRPRTSFADDVEPAPFRPSRKYARVQGSASVVGGSEDAFVDAGLALGRSFRVGWGPGGTLVHLGQICSPSGEPKGTANTSTVQTTVVPLVSPPAQEAHDLVTSLLTQHLTTSTIAKGPEDVPFVEPKLGFSFSTLLSLFPDTDRSFEASLFRLGHALFDPIDLRLPDSTSPELRHRVTEIRRKALLSKWLQNTVSPVVDAELRDNPGADWAETVFTLLSGNQVEKACEAAIDSGNAKLATLISQLPGDEEFGADLAAQLRLWREERVDAHINPSLRKVYALLAGIVEVLEGSKGAGVEYCPDINMTDGLSWKRAFGLHLWFGQLTEATIGQALDAYESQCRDPSSKVARPLPWYAEQNPDTKSLWKLPSPLWEHSPDALFSLIRLFADPSCTLSDILKPLSFTPSPVDYSIPWHLYIVLSRCLRARDFADRPYTTAATDVSTAPASEDEIIEEGHSPSADLLANSYALQLEQLDLIQEAAFVLLHIENYAGRRTAIKELLGRQAPKLDDWMTRGLVGSLRIPMEWVNEAKAVHALDCGDVFEAYELYLQAKMYNEAHELAVLELAPDAVIRQDYELLKTIFRNFEGHPVDGWHVRGKVFLDYAHAMTRLPELREGLLDRDAVPDASEEEERKQFARTVPKLVALLPDVLHDRTDVRHGAALAEMTAGLTLRLDQIEPLAIHQSRITTPFMKEDVRLRNVTAAALEKFLRSIEVA